jgi:hypothetical protein
MEEADEELKLDPGAPLLTKAGMRATKESHELRELLLKAIDSGEANSVLMATASWLSLRIERSICIAAEAHRIHMLKALERIEKAIDHVPRRDR